jgi:hypothetical protein
MTIASEIISGIVGSGGGLVRDIRAAITGKEIMTEKERLELLEKTAQLEQQILAAEQASQSDQVDVLKIDAAGNPFQRNWRPFVGWTCAAGLALYSVGVPLAQWIAAFYGLDIKTPNINFEPLWAVLMGMLGLGGYRTFEKVKGLK